ncbi:MAG: hypothetical protein ACTHK3_04005 [Solirubrobacterales bacterium]
MLSRIHNKLGTAGLVVAIVALVAALGGAAFAAVPGLNSKQKKEVKKIAKSYQGKGPTGPQGPAGSAGAAGAKGATGPAGAAGTTGPAGPTGPTGATGATGATGENGTFSTEPLPSGQTLTGAWSASGSKNTTSMGAISFPVRVSPAPTAVIENKFAEAFRLGYVLEDGQAKLLGPKASPEEFESEQEVIEAEEAFLEACPGNADTPKASAGFLCIYPKRFSTVLPPKESTCGAQSCTEAADEFGIVLTYKFTAENSYASGSWAVTK